MAGSLLRNLVNEFTRQIHIDRNSNGSRRTGQFTKLAVVLMLMRAVTFRALMRVPGLSSAIVVVMSVRMRAAMRVRLGIDTRLNRSLNADVMQWRVEELRTEQHRHSACCREESQN